MDLSSCILKIFNPERSEQMEEAQAAINLAKEQNPLELLKVLAELASNEDFPISKRKQIISIMTMPLKKRLSYFFLTNSCSTEVYEFVFQFLIPFLSLNNELSKISSEVLAIYCSAIRDLEYFMRIIQTITDESTDSYIYMILKPILSFKRSIPISISLASFLIDFAQSREFSEDTFIAVCKLISQTFPTLMNLKNCLEDEETKIFYLKIVEFIFSHIKEHPKAISHLFYYFCDKNIFILIPELTDMIIDSIYQNNEIIEHLPFSDSFNEEQIEFIVNILINRITIEDEEKSNNKVFYEGQFDKYPLTPVNSMLNHIFNTNINIIELILPFFQEHINENGSNEKYACAILNRIIIEAYSMASDKKSLTQSLEEIYPVQQESLYPIFLEDDDPRIQKYGLEILGDLIEENKIKITDDILQIAFQAILSDSESLKEGAADIFTAIGSKENQEATYSIAPHLWELIKNCNSTEEICGLQLVFQALRNLITKCTQEFAIDLISELFPKAMEVYEYDNENVSISWFISILNVLISKLSIEQGEIIQEIANLAIRFISENRIDEGILILTEVCKIVSQINEEIPSFCLSFAEKQILEVDNEQEIVSLIELLIAIINYMQIDHFSYFTDKLISIINNVVKFGNEKMITNIINIAAEFFANGSQKYPEVIVQYANQLIKYKNKDYSIKNFDAFIVYYQLLIQFIEENIKVDSNLTENEKFTVIHIFSCYIFCICMKIENDNEAKIEIQENLISYLQKYLEIMQEKMYIEDYNLEPLKQHCDSTRFNTIVSLAITD